MTKKGKARVANMLVADDDLLGELLRFKLETAGPELILDAVEPWLAKEGPLVQMAVDLSQPRRRDYIAGLRVGRDG